MVKSQRMLLFGLLAGLCLVCALSAPHAQAAPAAAPGPWCGGPLWKLMTLSDATRSAVKWTPAGTSIPDVAKLTAPGMLVPAGDRKSTRLNSSHDQISY